MSVLREGKDVPPVVTEQQGVVLKIHSQLVVSFCLPLTSGVTAAPAVEVLAVVGV